MSELPALGILGSGQGSNARAILEAIEGERLPARVKIIISDVADSGILRLAQERGIPAHYLPPGNARARLDPECERQMALLLREAGATLVALAGFLRIVGTPLLEAFPRRIINIHPSLLPKFPGLCAWRQALEAGASETGCTVHYVDQGVDTGEIIAQAKVCVLAGDTPESLHARIQEVEHRIYPQAIAKVLSE